MAQAQVSENIREVIRETVDVALLAGRIQAGREVVDTYKKTEQRLYAYPVILNKIESDKKYIDELAEHGAPTKSKSITRFSRSGLRLSPDEILDVLLQDLYARIAADEYEADTIAAALATIEDDPYYQAVTRKFFFNMSDDDIADAIVCDTSTVRRNRGRLVRRLSVWLYGASAL